MDSAAPLSSAYSRGSCNALVLRFLIARIYCGCYYDANMNFLELKTLVSNL